MSREDYELDAYPPDTIPGRQAWTRLIDRLVEAEAARDAQEGDR